MSSRSRVRIHAIAALRVYETHRDVDRRALENRGCRRPASPETMHEVRMPNCTVRYVVRLVPTVPDADPLDAIGVFREERMPDEVGEPGYLLDRRLTAFGGAAGTSLMEMVRHGDAWHMDVQERIDPLEWDS